VTLRDREEPGNLIAESVIVSYNALFTLMGVPVPFWDCTIIIFLAPSIHNV